MDDGTGDVFRCDTGEQHPAAAASVRPDQLQTTGIIRRFPVVVCCPGIVHIADEMAVVPLQILYVFAAEQDPGACRTQRPGKAKDRPLRPHRHTGIQRQRLSTVHQIVSRLQDHYTAGIASRLLQTGTQRLRRIGTAIPRRRNRRQMDFPNLHDIRSLAMPIFGALSVLYRKTAVCASGSGKFVRTSSAMTETPPRLTVLQ